MTRTRKEDRRQQELGPPKGWAERRRRVERRRPEVAEASLDEFLSLMAALSASRAELSKKPPPRGWDSLLRPD